MQLFSQRYPAWANHPLGWGPNDGTIGMYGCLETDFAMILTDTSHGLNPAALDDLLTQRQLFVRDETGTFDLLADNTLDLLFPGEYETRHVAGFDSAGIGPAVDSPDTYVILWISTAAVPTHFVIAWSRTAAQIADPWTGQVGYLAGYGGPGAVHKTTYVRHLPPPRPAPPPPPAPVPGPPVPVPTPPAVALYSFRVEPQPDQIPAGTFWIPPISEVQSLGDAISTADDWSSQHGAAAIKILDGDGQTVYDLPAGVVPEER